MPKPRRKSEHRKSKQRRKRPSYLNPLTNVQAAMLRHPLVQKRPGSRGLRIVVLKSGKCFLRGLRKDFAKYEKDIIDGKIPCPFTVKFKNTTYEERIRIGMGLGGPIYKSPIKKEGHVVCLRPLPLTLEGKPKIQLF